jgi:hypothetical protein
MKRPFFEISAWIVSMALTVLAAGCYSSSGRENRQDAVEDIRPDPVPEIQMDRQEAPDPVPPDIYPDSEVQCTTDEDCTVVLDQNRCCGPDPRAMPRALVGSNPCYHELGQPWMENPGCPEILCEWCPPIEHRAYGARCEAGTCVLVEDFCEPMRAPTPVASLDAWSVPPGGWERYRGQVIQLRGYPNLGPYSCRCLDDDCDCLDEQVQQTLGCMVSMRGSVCGEPWECGGTECSPQCSPRLLANEVVVTGYLVDSVYDGWEIWVVSKDNDCPPPGPNPEWAPCTPLGDDDCAEGLFCYYWGDVVMDCIGTCRPPGTECATAEDCDEGDVCYHGYCEWCCPG